MTKTNVCLVVMLLTKFLCTFASVLTPLQQLLDKSCTPVLYKSYGLVQDLLFDEGIMELPGYLVLNGKNSKWKLFNKMRSTWPCFDVISTTDQKANDIANPSFEARNTRYIYVREITNNSNTLASRNHPVNDKSALLRHQTVMLLEPSRSLSTKVGFDLWLLCPPEISKAQMLVRKINIFHSKQMSFVGNTHQERNVYRLCNEKGFYHGKSLTYTGISYEGIGNLPLNLAKIVADKVGATYKYRHSWGCLLIKSKLPLPHTTLGLLYSNKADLGGNVGLNSQIFKLYDYIFYTYEEYFFVGPKPELLHQIENITYPFDALTWLFSYISLLVAAVLSLLIHFVNKGQIKLDPFLLIFGMTFMENHFSLFKRTPSSGVLIRNFWLVGVTLLTMAYHGTLKASLTKRTYERETITHWDMLDKDLPVYAYFVQQLSGNATRDYYPKMRAHILEKDTLIMYHETFVVLDRIFKGEKAFIFSSTLQDIMFENIYIAKYGPDNYPLRRVKDEFDYSFPAMCVKKYSPQTDELKTVVDHLWASGIPTHEYIKYSFYHGKKELVSVKEEKIGSEHFLLLFVILLASYILGFLAIVLENRKPTKKSKKALYQIIKRMSIHKYSTVHI